MESYLRTNKTIFGFTTDFSDAVNTFFDENAALVEADFDKLYIAALTGEVDYFTAYDVNPNFFMINVREVFLLLIR